MFRPLSRPAVPSFSRTPFHLVLRQRTRLAPCGAFLLGLALAAPAMAEAQPDAPEEPAWSVGIGVGVFSSPYRDAKTIVLPVPWLAYDSERLHLSLYELEYRAWRAGPFVISAIAIPRFPITEPRDSPYLDGMARRKATMEAGGRIALEGEYGALRLDLQTDVLDHHGGSQVALNYGYEFHLGALSITPSASLTWQSDKLADYYYGVRPDEATPARPAYQAGGALMPGAAIEMHYPLTRQTSLMLQASITGLPKSINESPIVDDKTSAQMIAGAIYRF